MAEQQWSNHYVGGGWNAVSGNLSFVFLLLNWQTRRVTSKMTSYILFFSYISLFFVMRIVLTPTDRVSIVFLFLEHAISRPIMVQGAAAIHQQQQNSSSVMSPRSAGESSGLCVRMVENVLSSSPTSVNTRDGVQFVCLFLANVTLIIGFVLG